MGALSWIAVLVAGTCPLCAPLGEDGDRVACGHLWIGHPGPVSDSEVAAAHERWAYDEGRRAGFSEGRGIGFEEGFVAGFDAGVVKCRVAGDE